VFRFSRRFLLKKMVFCIFHRVGYKFVPTSRRNVLPSYSQCLNFVATRHNEASNFFHTSERMCHATSIRTQKTVETEADLKEDADANILRRKELPDGYIP
jgi:hypothetical protein